MAIVPQAVLKRLATLLVAGGTGVGAAAGTAELPDDLVDALLESEELDELDRTRLVRLLAHDARPRVRQRLAIALTDQQIAPADTAVILEQLAHDPDPRVTRAVGAALGSLWERLKPLDRSELVCAWAAAEHEGVRFALAFALAWPVDTVGVRTAIETLLDDPSADVRTAATRAHRLRAAPA